MSVPVQEIDTPHATEQPTGYAIDVEGVSVRYGGTVAVHDLSMHVPPGSVYGLVGPSGAGKSTVMRVLATLQPPDAGTVLVDGIDIRRNPAAARARIGYLPDFSGHYDELTVAEYLDFYGAIYGVQARRRRQIASELLELTGLTDRRGDPVKGLSRGMRQKLGLARCLIHDPPVLLLDEPASGLDPASRLDLRDILQELASLGKTVLISSHMLHDLAEICSHLGILRAGELIAEGSTDDIIRGIAPDVRVRVNLLSLHQREQARRVLEAQRTCRDVQDAGAAALIAHFEGTQQDLAAILGHLSSGGVLVTEFKTERSSLEDALLRVLDTEVEA